MELCNIILKEGNLVYAAVKSMACVMDMYSVCHCLYPTLLYCFKNVINLQTVQ